MNLEDSTLRRFRTWYVVDPKDAFYIEFELAVIVLHNLEIQCTVSVKVDCSCIDRHKGIVVWIKWTLKIPDGPWSEVNSAAEL